LDSPIVEKVYIIRVVSKLLSSRESGNMEKEEKSAGEEITGLLPVAKEVNDRLL
jgi:hypothetical protein